MAKIEFWYEFASTYSYLSAMRIEVLAKAAGVEIEWRPFLLGPILKASGWDDSPFNIYPAKGRYMARDVARLTAERGLPFAMPAQFPQNSLTAARVAALGAGEPWIGDFTRAVFDAEFGRGIDISDRGEIARLLDGLGLDSAALLRGIEEPDIKQRLRVQTETAAALGIFGAPSFRVGEEMFWGDDRLEQALRWAKRP